MDDFSVSFVCGHAQPKSLLYKKFRNISMEESITFREATLDDLPFMSNGVYQVFEAENLLNVYKKDVEDVKIKRAIEGNRVFIAEQNNGYIQYAFNDKYPYGITYGTWKNKFCWVDNVYVHPDYRGRGISKLLHQHLEKHCLANNIKEIMLDVYVVNKSSIDVHEKLGFAPLTCVYSKSVE